MPNNPNLKIISTDEKRIDENKKSIKLTGKLFIEFN